MHQESIEAKKYSKKLHNLLLRIIHDKLEDPIFKRITINHLRLNRTKTMATVYLDLASIKESWKKNLVIRKINKLNGLFKNSLQEHINKYRIPHLKFVEDKLFERGQQVEKLINESIENGKRGH